MNESTLSPAGLAVAREGLGMTQAHLANYTHMKSAQRIKEIETGRRSLAEHVSWAILDLEEIRDQLIDELSQADSGTLTTFDNNPDFWKAYPGLRGVPHHVHRIAAAFAAANIADSTGQRPDVRIVSNSRSDQAKIVLELDYGQLCALIEAVAYEQNATKGITGEHVNTAEELTDVAGLLHQALTVHLVSKAHGKQLP
jgi:transcriptional regulator with XRE-family HTH domain